MFLEIAGIISLIVAIIALLISTFIFIKPSSRSGLIYYITLFLVLLSLAYVIHAGIEAVGPALGLGEELEEQLYAVTSVVASLFGFFLVMIVRIISKLLIKR